MLLAAQMTQGSVFSVPQLPKPVRRVAAFVREVLPDGRPLPDDTWKAHHAVILVVLWFHLPVVLIAAAYTGREFAAGVLAVAPVAAVAVVASPPVWGRRVAATLATLGLVTASAVLVHLTGGVIETHFHFFVVVALASSYHDWAPLLSTIGFVAAEHGIVGAIAPHSVYDHSDAAMHPWRWAAIHAMFITLTAAAGLLGWRATEKAQDAERQLMDRVSDLATRDELTGLANRRFLHAKIDELANERASRVGIDDDETFSLILLDIDDFKVINDSLGHVAGDALLVSAGERLVRVIGAAGMVARLGGDEFAVLVWRGGKRAATRLAERIVAVFHDEFVIAGGPVRRHASLGVAVAGWGSSASVLLRDADLAMYAAKAAGKGMVAVYSTEMLATVQQRLQRENHLRHALDRGEMSVHYQPVVEAASGEVLAVEALLRWTHPSWGDVLPSTFIPLAESSGAISQLGEWVLRRACTDVMVLSADRSKPLRVSVNVSVRQL
nr:diguanylate cyclase [Nocardioidaceae bacterium]